MPSGKHTYAGYPSHLLVSRSCLNFLYPICHQAYATLLLSQTHGQSLRHVSIAHAHDCHVTRTTIVCSKFLCSVPHFTTSASSVRFVICHHRWRSAQLCTVPIRRVPHRPDLHHEVRCCGQHACSSCMAMHASHALFTNCVVMSSASRSARNQSTPGETSHARASVLNKRTCFCNMSSCSCWHVTSTGAPGRPAHCKRPNSDDTSFSLST